MQQLTQETDAALAERVLDAALLVTRMGRAEIRRRAPGGLSASQVRALSFLDQHAGSSLAELAGNVGLGAPAASRVVDDLVRRGLATRAEAADDRRRVSLRLLPAGARALASARAVARAPLAARLAGLGPEEKARLWEAVTSLREALLRPAVEEDSGG